MSDPPDSRETYFLPEVLNRISRLELRARHVVEGFVSGMHESPFKGFSIEFADHRPYTPGDDLRRIDWRVYAKSDRFFIKEYEVETNVRTHLLLDCSGSMAYPEHAAGGRMTKWDYAATVAVSLAHLLVIRQSDAAGLVLFDDAVREQLPARDNRAALAALAELVERHAPAGPTDLKVPFAKLADALPRRGMVVILSDLLTDVDALIDGLQHFQAARHDVIVMHVLDRDELEFPFTDRTLFEGLEAPGVELVTDPQSLRSTYLSAVRGFVETIQAACLDRRIEYCLVSTADPVDLTLATFLAGRMHRLRSRR